VTNAEHMISSRHIVSKSSLKIPIIFSAYGANLDSRTEEILNVVDKIDMPLYLLQLPTLDTVKIRQARRNPHHTNLHTN
jgi:hypothetical protein